jgi:general secretion pathway protein K
MAISNRRRGSRGGALLAVLWLSAALSAIAFSLANTVRGETERTSTAVEGLRTQYLAQGGVERGILRVKWALDGGMLPNIPGRYSPANPILPFSFPSGEALVEVIPETAKININLCQPVMLLRLFLALGVDPARAGEIVLAVVDWRGPAGLTPFDAFYSSLTPSFRARHASFEEIEELLLVRGITRDLFYGGYDRDAQGRLIPRAGLKDCVSVFGSTDAFDVNTAQPAVLIATGIPPEAAAAIVARRRMQPFQNVQQVGAFAPGGAEISHLRTGGNSIFTMRSTARLTLPNGKLSDLRRTCAATVKFMPPDYENRIQILRWYENAWTP